jgi:DNA polymerase epsilon subunit 2
MIRLDLSNPRSFDRFYTEGSVVVVQGELVSKGLFRVNEIALPPAEMRSTTLTAVGINDVFGSGFRPQHVQQMQELEESADHHLIVVLSEVHLDKPHVLEKLKQILAVYEENGLEPLYVFIGSFFSKPYFKVANGKEIMKQAFDNLGLIIASYEGQQQRSKFVFVPGAWDGGSNATFPRRSISTLLMSSLQERVTHIKFVSNPCKLRCFTQEIVVFREDLLRKMQKHLMLPLATDVADTPSVVEQLVMSILDQAHLSPLPLHARPIHWELDHAMRLFPLPHLVSIRLFGLLSCSS